MADAECGLPPAAWDRPSAVRAGRRFADEVFDQQAAVVARNVVIRHAAVQEPTAVQAQRRLDEEARRGPATRSPVRGSIATDVTAPSWAM